MALLLLHFEDFSLPTMQNRRDVPRAPAKEQARSWPPEASDVTADPNVRSRFLPDDSPNKGLKTAGPSDGLCKGSGVGRGSKPA